MNIHFVIGADAEQKNPVQLHLSTDAEAANAAYRKHQAAGEYPHVVYFRKPVHHKRCKTAATAMPGKKRRGRPPGSAKLGEEGEGDKEGDKEEETGALDPAETGEVKTESKASIQPTEAEKSAVASLFQ